MSKVQWLCLSFWACIANCYAEKIALHSYFIPGLVESPTQGLLIDMLKEIEQQGVLNFEVSLLPTQRTQQHFKAGRVQAYFPELEDFQPEKSCRTVAFMQKKIITVTLKSAQPINNISQLEGKKVGAVTGFSYGSDIINNPNIRLERVNNDMANLDKLLAGRIDVIIGDINSTVAAIKARNLQSELRYNVDKPVSLLDVFFVFQDDPVGNADCEKVSVALEQLRKTGYLKKVFNYQ